MAGPTFGSEGSTESGTANSASVAAPPGVVAGKVVLVILFRTLGSYEALTLPGGWALVPDNPGLGGSNSGHNVLHDVIWHRASGSESGSYTFSWSTACFQAGVAVRLDGCATTGTPFEVDDGAASVAPAANLATTPPVAVTTTSPDRLLVWTGGSWTTGAWTMPSGFTGNVIDVPFDLLALGTKAQAAAGASGSLVGTQNFESHTAWVGAFVPTAAGGTTVPVSVAGSVAPTGTLTRGAQRRLAGSSTPSGMASRLTGRRLVGSVSPSGVLGMIRTRILALAGAVAPDGSLLRRAGKPLSGGVVPGGAVAKLPARRVAGSVTPSGVVSAVRSVLVALAGAVAPSGVLVRRPGKSVAGTVTPSAGITRRTGKALAGAAAPSGVALKLLARLLGGATAPSGASTHVLQVVVPTIRGSMRAVSRRTTEMVGASRAGPTMRKG